MCLSNTLFLWGLVIWTIVKFLIFSTENFPPQLVNASSVIEATVGKTVVVKLTATDKNNDTITFSVTNQPPEASTNTSNNVLTFTWPVKSRQRVSRTSVVKCLTAGSLLLFNQAENLVVGNICDNLNFAIFKGWYFATLNFAILENLCKPRLSLSRH